MKQKDMQEQRQPRIRGRGAQDNPTGRFEREARDTDAETYNALYEAGAVEAEVQQRTEILRDSSRSIISTNDSPDIGMETTLNPYRGCEHGCIYCYARPTHEYLGLSAGTDFESKIFVKYEAATLLRQKLESRAWQPRTVSLSGVTDPYQPLERRLEITRGCLAVLRDFANPAVIITKNHLVTRDIDILRDMAAMQTIAVKISLTTLDGGLARVMEPRTSTPARRLAAVEALAQAGVPVGIMMGPVLPGLTEHEIPTLLKAAADAGARDAHYTMLRLPHGVKDLFQSWLAEHYPDRAQKVLNHLRGMHNGKLYDSSYGTRMRGKGIYAAQIAQVFALYRKKYGLTQRTALSTAAFRRPAADGQMSLF